ncbi:hypothetical protein [Sphingomonas sp.]|uniref:hypothetical protein n=1 Tax=Sphingomonas sp. TaxID=28214 RepID=UPI0035C78C7C
MKPAKTAPAPAPQPVKTLDPFGYWPASESRIGGLGGSAAPADPAYAFHSVYVDIGGGIVVCRLRFERLEATIGMLAIHVMGLAPAADARAEMIRSWTADLRDVAESDGVLELSFQASAGTRYAVVGHIYAESDARARSLAIELELTPDASSTSGQEAVRKSLFGRRVFRRTARMVVRTRPTLADPVCQPCTRAQFDEPVYARWAAEMQQPALHDSRQWCEIFILQTLERYGMLRPGAQGLGFGVRPWTGPAIMAARGCSIVVSDFGGSEGDAGRAQPSAVSALLEDLRFPSICADDIFDRQVSTRTIDITNLGPKLSGFDFAWSAGALEHLGSIATAQAFMRDSVGTLTLGGIAVHTTLLNIGSTMDTVDDASTVLFRRQDIERIAVDLVSRGHYVAQLAFDLGDPPIEPESGALLAPKDPELAAALDELGAIPFGLIVRRGDR